MNFNILTDEAPLQLQIYFIFDLSVYVCANVCRPAKAREGSQKPWGESHGCLGRWVLSSCTLSEQQALFTSQPLPRP